MLPDLRIVIATVLSTFVLSAGVGFYASSRLIGEARKTSETIASFEETPVNRIALSWPEPTRQPDQPALDFAVTAKALRNPVRDISSERPVEPVSHPARETASDLPAIVSETPAKQEPAKAEPVPVRTEAVMPQLIEVTEPDIRVAVQYPPVVNLPPELQPPLVPKAAVAEAPVADTPVTTGSVVEDTASAPASTTAVPAASAPEPRVANRPEPAEAEAEGLDTDDDASAQDVPLPKAAPGIKPKKITKKKKPAPRKVRRIIRQANPATTVPNFFGFFAVQQRR